MTPDEFKIFKKAYSERPDLSPYFSAANEIFKVRRPWDINDLSSFAEDVSYLK